MERLRTIHADKLRALVVCGGGCATAYMLISRIQAEFPEISVVEVCSMLELTKEKILFANPDLIITTVPLRNISVPNLLVNPLLNDEDKIAISQHLDKIQGSINSANSQETIPGFTIMNLLTDKTIQAGEKAKNWQEGVEKACQPLIAENLIEPKYIEAIIDLLNQHGPYMVLSRGVVLLHAMIGYGVHQLCMGLTTFSPPVRFGHKYNDPVSAAIVFGTVDSRSHLKALSQLSRLLGDSDLIQNICTCRTSKNILDLIQSAMQN